MVNSSCSSKELHLLRVAEASSPALGHILGDERRMMWDELQWHDNLPAVVIRLAVHQSCDCCVQSVGTTLSIPRTQEAIIPDWFPLLSPYWVTSNYWVIRMWILQVSWNPSPLKMRDNVAYHRFNQALLWRHPNSPIGLWMWPEVKMDSIPQ